MINVHGQDEGESKTELGPVTSSSGGWEDLMGEERERIEELLKSKGMQRGSYPPYSVSVKGPKVPCLIAEQ